MGPIETYDLRWYLEEYYRWPVGLFKDRAKRIEAQIPEWGKLLYDSVFSGPAAREALNAWQHDAGSTERRFSVLVDAEPPEGTDAKKSASMAQSASGLLSLPWELLHDGRSYLFQGRYPAVVRRRLPNRVQQEVALTKLPIRILLISPRPEDKHTDYIDHRISALPIERKHKLTTIHIIQ